MACEWANVQVHFVKVKVPGGQAQTLGRLVDTTGAAWFSVRQAGKLLLGESGSNANRLRCRLRHAMWVTRSATQEEARLLSKANVVHGHAPLLANPGDLADVLLSLGVSSDIADCVREEHAHQLVKSLPFECGCCLSGEGGAKWQKERRDGGGRERRERKRDKRQEYALSHSLAPCIMSTPPGL